MAAKIIGSGDIAGALKELQSFADLVFFASGVSNSQCVASAEFARERDLLLRQDTDRQLVYFSTLSIFYADTPYTRHKRFMETLIKEHFPVSTIVRIGNIDWGENPNTLINYLRAHPKAELRDEYRYIISKDEFLHWMRLVPGWSCEMNCPGERLKVKEIYARYVKK